MPFSRQSSPTPPGPSQQEEVGQHAALGSRRGSWGGAWAQVETGMAGSHWPSRGVPPGCGKNRDACQLYDSQSDGPFIVISNCH